jgi:hypothetical protein
LESGNRDDVALDAVKRKRLLAVLVRRHLLTESSCGPSAGLVAERPHRQQIVRQERRCRRRVLAKRGGVAFESRQPSPPRVDERPGQGVVIRGYPVGPLQLHPGVVCLTEMKQRMPVQGSDGRQQPHIARLPARLVPPSTRSVCGSLESCMTWWVTPSVSSSCRQGPSG